jgi:hypothetical protein
MGELCITQIGLMGELFYPLIGLMGEPLKREIKSLKRYLLLSRREGGNLTD